MPRFNVQLPNGKWRVWSTICDDWVTDPMTFDELKTYRREKAIAEADAESDSLLTDNPQVNILTYDEWWESLDDATC